MSHIGLRACLAAVVCLGCSNGASSETAQDTVADAAPEWDGGTEPMPEASPDALDAGPSWPLDMVTVTWEPCSLVDGADDGLAECASTPMPLFWDAPDGRTMEIRAKRLLASGKARSQLWLLQGGPGGSGVVGLPLSMQRFHDLDPELDVYTLDHRGTGYSSRFGCPVGEDPSSPFGTSLIVSEIEDCVAAMQTEHPDELKAMTATYSSVDLAAYVHATREPGKSVIVSGSSYGSYWAHRYLQVMPAQADGVMVQGIAPPDLTFIRFDERANQTGEQFMAVCGADSFCSSKLGTDPWKRLGDLLTNLQNGHCSALQLTRWDFSLLLAFALYYYPTNSVVPALVYRAERCEADDQAAIQSAWDFFLGAGGVFDLKSYSIMLQYHVTFSELWASPDFANVDLESYFADLRQNAYVSKNAGPTKLALMQNWPAYQDPTWDDGWAKTDIPMLMMQGKLDPATSYADALPMKDHFNGTWQHWVEFPQAPHGVTSATPVSVDGGIPHCGTQLFLAFIKDPKAPLDTSCVASVLPINFRGTPELAAAILATGDFWESTDGAAAPAGSRSSLQNRLREQGTPW